MQAFLFKIAKSCNLLSHIYLSNACCYWVATLNHGRPDSFLAEKVKLKKIFDNLPPTTFQWISEGLILNNPAQIGEFLKILPRDRKELQNPEMSAAISFLCTRAERFSEAMADAEYFLRPITYSYDIDKVLESVSKAQLSERYPKEVLNLLEKIIDDTSPYRPALLEEILIRTLKDKTLKSNPI